MRCGRTWIRGVVLAFVPWLAAAGPREPVPLNDYSRLGQRFVAPQAVAAIAVTVPSWLDAEGGLTLTLWDSPERSRQIAQQVFVGIQDNAAAELVFAKPLPAGTYYWEIGARTGETRVGLYADRLDAPSDECVYVDGKPDPTRRFVFRVVPAPFPFAGLEDMLAALSADRPLWERTEACRQLAVMGDRRAIPVLAGLLADETLAHMARFALEPMPEAAVDVAFRDALGSLQGDPLRGVINSVAVRRDPKAVRPLRACLADASPGVAAAAAVALGRIGTPAAVEALEKALEDAPETLTPALYEGLLEGAARLAEEGHERRARGVYDRLRHADATSAAVRRAALRGAIVTRGADGVALLVEALGGPDQALAATALWVAQHELPGDAASAALAKALPTLPAGVQPRLADALCSRLDAAALAAAVALARGEGTGDRSVRLAAIRGLPRTRPRATPVADVLTAALGDPDEEVAAAAAGALGELPAGVADAHLTAMLQTAPGKGRAAAIQVVGARRIESAVPALLNAAADPDPTTRTAALRALGDLAGQEQVPRLLELLLSAATPEDCDNVEKALRGTLAKVPEPAVWADRLTALLPAAPPARQRSLLRLLHTLGGPAAFAAVRGATADADAETREQAYRLLSEWKTPDAAEGLLQAATAAVALSDRVLCLRGAIRLAGSRDLPAEQRLGLCRKAAPLVTRDEERKLLLGVLGGTPAVEALDLALPCLDEAAVRPEAALAVLAIAEPLARGPDAAKATAALEHVARAVPGTDQARRAQEILAQVRAAAPTK